MKKISAVLVVLALATVASADLVGIVKTNTFTLAGADYDVYEVIVEPTTPGFRIYSVDTPLLQAWRDTGRDFIKTPYADYFLDSEPELGMDTHFMVENPDEDIKALEVAEQNDASIGLVGPTNWYTFGFGELVGSYAWETGPAPTENWVAAQLVVAAGSEFTIVGETSTDDNAPGGYQQIDFNVTVPEPATMTLLAIGGLGALIRRKRR